MSPSRHPLYPRPASLAPAALVLLLVGCSGPDGNTVRAPMSPGAGTAEPDLSSGGQTGSETGLACVVGEEGLVDDADDARVGFSAAAVLDALRGTHVGVFEWTDEGAVASASLAVERGAGPARFQSLVPPPQPAGSEAGEIDMSCEGRLQIPVVVQLVVEAGASGPEALNERFEYTLVATSPTRASAALPIERFGELDLSGLDLDPAQTASLNALFSVFGSELRLEVGGTIATSAASERDGDPDPLVVSATPLDIGEFRGQLGSSR